MNFSQCDPLTLSQLTAATWICCSSEHNLPAENVPVTVLLDTGRGIEQSSGCQWLRSGDTNGFVRWYGSNGNRMFWPVLGWLYLPPVEITMDKKKVAEFKHHGRMTTSGELIRE